MGFSTLLVDPAESCVVFGIVGAPAMPSLSCTAVAATIIWEFLFGGCSKSDVSCVKPDPLTLQLAQSLAFGS